MRTKSLSFFVGMIVLVSLIAPSLYAGALDTQPQNVRFTNAQGINLTGWLFKPDGNGPYPAVVMMPGCMGISSFGEGGEEINPIYLEWSERLVNTGYVALLVDSFTPRNSPQNQCGNVSEIDDRPYDAYAGLDYLASQPFVASGNIGLMGWSHGASSVMAALDQSKFTSRSSFNAAVAFYPGCALGYAFGEVKQSSWRPYAPFVILQGSADPVADPAACATRVALAQELGAESVTINIFEHAQHRFDAAGLVADAFTEHDMDAKFAADAQVLHFFEMHLP